MMIAASVVDGMSTDPVPPLRSILSGFGKVARMLAAPVAGSITPLIVSIFPDSGYTEPSANFKDPVFVSRS